VCAEGAIVEYIKTVGTYSNHWPLKGYNKAVAVKDIVIVILSSLSNSLKYITT
jgi:hypothetical protein